MGCYGGRADKHKTAGKEFKNNRCIAKWERGDQLVIGKFNYLIGNKRKGRRKGGREDYKKNSYFTGELMRMNTLNCASLVHWLHPNVFHLLTV